MILELPPLREELVVREGPRARDGQPGWMLHDPARNRFFRLDWLTFEVFQRWSLGQPLLIAQSVSEQTVLAATVADVEAILRFAQGNSLLQFSGGAKASDLAKAQRNSQPSWWLWLVHNYLFFRVPLVRPERALRALYAVASFVFLPAFWRLTLAVFLTGAVLVYRQWETFAASWVETATVQGLIGAAVVLVVAKVIHEFGHGLAATHYGVRVPTMGIAFLVMTPVAYTDTNEAWNLTARRPRLMINAGGMLAELCLAAWSTLAWCLVPDGTLRSFLFVVAAVTWLKSIVINVSPIMRFDGYYLLSDYLEVPNLHSRCFALARWRIREWLFALGELPPEPFRPPLRNGLIALGFFIWVYRLIVFVGIAIFVYHFFFKALGIVLFAVEIAWFVLIPIISEVKVWRTKWATIRRSRRFFVVSSGCVALLVLGFVPLPRHVSIAGQLYPMEEFHLVAPESGLLAEFSVADSTAVEVGRVLLRIDSEILQYRLQKGRAREQSLRAQIAATAANPAARAQVPMLQAELATLTAALEGAARDALQLSPAAPFPGIFRHAAATTHRPGEWVVKGEILGTVVGTGDWRAVGYVAEQEAHLVTPDQVARFFPEGAAHQVIRLRVLSVESDTSRELAYPMLAKAAGGSVATQVEDDRLVTTAAVYRVTFAIVDPHPAVLDRIRRGDLSITAGSEPPLARFGRSASGVLWRELGF